MAVQDPRKGYHNSRSPEETEMECPVCFNVLCEPKLAACCGRSVCAACIDQIESGEKSCLLCSQKTQSVDDKHLKRPLDGIDIHCTHKEQGCECAGVHHNKQPTTITDDLLTGCQFQKIRCEAVQSHQCQCQLAKHHVLSGCPEHDSTIECEYQYVGCAFQGSHLELDGHMSKAMGTHLSLLSKFVQSRLSQNDDEVCAIKEELKALQRDRKMKEKLAQQGKVELQQLTERSQQVRQPGTEQIRQSKQHTIPCWMLILFLFLVAGGVNAYLYQVWHSECNCSQDVPFNDLCVRKIDIDRQVQQLDYRVALVKTTLLAEMNELKLTISKTNQIVEGVGYDLNLIKEILLRTEQKKSLEMKESEE
jgi:hypothetical protein